MSVSIDLPAEAVDPKDETASLREELGVVAAERDALAAEVATLRTSHDYMRSQRDRYFAYELGLNAIAKATDLKEAQAAAEKAKDDGAAAISAGR